MFRTLALFRRLGLPEDIDEAITKVQGAIALWNQYRLTVAAAQAASGPIGWGLLAVSVAATVVSTAEMGAQIENELRGR